MVKLPALSKTRYRTLKLKSLETQKLWKTENGSKSTNRKSQTMTLCFLGGSLRCEGDRKVQILIDVVKKPKIQRRFWHGRSCVFETTLKRKKFGAFNTRNTFPRVAKILYRSSSRQWTAIKNLQWNYLKGRILLQANNKLLVSPLQLLSGSIIILSPAFKVCIQDSILHNNYGGVCEQLAEVPAI